MRLSPPTFFVFFAILWLLVGLLLGLLAGWFRLARRYPDRGEAATLEVKRQSASMGLGVHLSGVLSLGVCPSGLRICVMRLFGVFWRPFLVPWHDVTVERRKGLFAEAAVLRFGRPPVGRLKLAGYLADRLARSAPGLWPEAGPFPKETARQTLKAVGKRWFALTSPAAAFFIVAPRVAEPNLDQYPPIAVAILFPALAFGMQGVVQYVSRRRD